MIIMMAAFNNFADTLPRNLATTLDIETKRIFAPDKGNNPAAVAQMDPDAGLVARVQNGDREAFGELIARHSRRVYRTLMAITKDTEETQDAMQDAFLKAFLHIDEFQSRSRFSTWLTRIASNTALQRLRGRKRLDLLSAPKNGSELDSLPIRARNAGPEQLHLQAERRRLVERGLEKVPSKYRAVLVLRDIEQLSTEEAATALGIGIPALKARLFRARRMLREALSPYFVVDTRRVDEHK